MVSTILGRKIGMTQVWDEDDNVVPVTVIQAGPCVVSQVKTKATDAMTPYRSASAVFPPSMSTSQWLVTFLVPALSHALSARGSCRER